MSIECQSYFINYYLLIKPVSDSVKIRIKFFFNLNNTRFVIELGRNCQNKRKKKLTFQISNKVLRNRVTPQVDFWKSNVRKKHQSQNTRHNLSNYRSMSKNRYIRTQNNSRNSCLTLYLPRNDKKTLVFLTEFHQDIELLVRVYVIAKRTYHLACIPRTWVEPWS